MVFHAIITLRSLRLPALIVDPTRLDVQDCNNRGPAWRSPDRDQTGRFQAIQAPILGADSRGGTMTKLGKGDLVPAIEKWASDLLEYEKWGRRHPSEA